MRDAYGQLPMHTELAASTVVRLEGRESIGTVAGLLGQLQAYWDSCRPMRVVGSTHLAMNTGCG